MGAIDYAIGWYAAPKNTEPRGSFSGSVEPKKGSLNPPPKALSTRYDPAIVNDGVRRTVMSIIDSVPGGGSVKLRLSVASKLLGLSFDRVRQYYQNKVRRIEAHEYVQIIERAQIAKRAHYERVRAQYAQLREELLAEASGRMVWMVPPEADQIGDLDSGNPAEDL